MSWYMSLLAVSYIKRPSTQNSNEANKTTGWNSENNVTTWMGRAAFIYMTMLRCSLASQNDCCYENGLTEQEWATLTTVLNVPCSYCRCRRAVAVPTNTIHSQHQNAWWLSLYSASFEYHYELDFTLLYHNHCSYNAPLNSQWPINRRKENSLPMRILHSTKVSSIRRAINLKVVYATILLLTIINTVMFVSYYKNIIKINLQ